MNGVFPRERPNFGKKQVRSLRGVKPGTILVHLYTGKFPSKETILVIQEPFKDNKGTWWFDGIVLCGESKGNMERYSLADCSVVLNMDSTGKTCFWNPFNYLLRTGKKRLAQRQVKKLVKKIFRNDYTHLFGSWNS